MIAETARPVCATCGGELRAGGVCPHCMFTTVFGADDDFAEEPAPSVLGDYELIEEIGRGGAGVVWRARQRRLNRIVALKLLRESSLPGEAMARRFRIEAEAAARLRHPHIVSVHEVGEVGGRWFLSMELLAGTLAGRGAMEARAAAELLAKIARAVQHAHDRGILHRDLKPANVLLDDAGEPRVADFGLARFAEDDSTLTVSGTVLGTPAYMSPEQAAGRELTTTSDVYSLGAIFYELLAGRPPFEGATMVEIIRKVCDEEPRRLTTRRGGMIPPSGCDPSGPQPAKAVEKPDELSNSDASTTSHRLAVTRAERRAPEGGIKPPLLAIPVPRDLEVIALKCLEKNPASRYASALALAEELDCWLRGEPILSRRATATERLWKWARRRPALAALWTTVALALIVILFGGAIFNRHLDAQRQKAEAATQATLHRLARQHARGALHFMETGDWQRGLLSLAEAVEIGSGDDSIDRLNRLRFESIVQFGPRLEGLWFPLPGERWRTLFSGDGKSALLVQKRSAHFCDGPALEHHAEILGAEVNADGSRVICGTSDGRWTLWDPRAGKVIASGEGRVRAFPENLVSRMRGTFAGDRFVVVQRDIVVRQFRALDGQQAVGDVTHARPVQWAVLAPDAEQLFTLTDDGILRFFAGDDPEQMSPLLQFDPRALPQSFYNGQLVNNGLGIFLNGGENFTLVGWKHDRRASVLHENQHHFTGRGHIIAMGWQNQQYSFYMTTTNDGASIRSPWQDNANTELVMGTRITVADFDDFGHTAVTLAVNGAAQRWELEPNRAQPAGPRLWFIGKPVETRLSPDGLTTAVITSEASWLWKCRARDGAHVSLHTGGNLRAVSFSADAATLRMTLIDGSVQDWNVASGERSQTSPQDAPATPEAKPHFHAARGEDQSVRIVEVATGRVVAPPIMHPAPVENARFSPDGRLLCTLWGRRFARLWDTVTGEPVTPPLVHPGSDDAVWSPDGRWLATFGKSAAEVRVWDFATGNRAPGEMKTLARLLSAHRLVPGSDHGIIALGADELRAAWEQAGAAQPK